MVSPDLGDSIWLPGSSFTLKDLAVRVMNSTAIRQSPLTMLLMEMW